MALNKSIEKTNKDASKDKPVTKFQAGVVQASIWENTAIGKDGKEVKFFSVTFQRGYKDKDDKWQNTTSMRVNDLPKLAVVLNKCYEALVLDAKDEE